MRAAFRAEGLSKSFTSRSGMEVEALADISLECAAGELTCVLGPTGSGKSTLLRILAGLDEPDKGTVEVGGVEPTSMAGHVGYLTQQHALLPWLRVRDNIALPLEFKGAAPATRRRRADEIAACLGLEGFGDLYPYELSGGMQRRAALGRLMALEAPYWLLDEPFTSLDERTQHGLQALLLDLIAEHGVSTIFVTHSVDEAVFLADNLMVLSPAPARIAESFRPGLHRPRNRLSEDYGAAMERIRKSLESALSED